MRQELEMVPVAPIQEVSSRKEEDSESMSIQGLPEPEELLRPLETTHKPVPTALKDDHHIVEEVAPQP